MVKVVLVKHESYRLDYFSIREIHPVDIPSGKIRVRDNKGFGVRVGPYCIFPCPHLF